MFTRQATIGQVRGIPIRLDASWFLIVTLLTWNLARHLFPVEYKGLSDSTYWIMGLIGALLLFFSVLLHELGHSLVGRLFGVRIRSITLFLFGGVAEMIEEPRRPIGEFCMAIAGPLVSIVLALLLKAFLSATHGLIPVEVYAVADYLCLVNTGLAILNLIPAFPLDGGRVLRSILWYFTGRLNRATRIASILGRGFGYLFVSMGIVLMIIGLAYGSIDQVVSGFWTMLIGVFLKGAAEGSYQNLTIRTALEGLQVKDFLTRSMVTIPGEMPVDVAVSTCFMRQPFDVYPVTSDGHIVALIEAASVKRIPRERWSKMRVSDLGTNQLLDLAVHPDDDALLALQVMTQNRLGQLPVVSDEHLLGLISRRDIMEILRVRTEFAA